VADSQSPTVPANHIVVSVDPHEIVTRAFATSVHFLCDDIVFLRMRIDRSGAAGLYISRSFFSKFRLGENNSLRVEIDAPEMRGGSQELHTNSRPFIVCIS
jgi:hypothetical protein